MATFVVIRNDKKHEIIFERHFSNTALGDFE